MRALILLLLLSGCGSPTGCLYNSYDGKPPRASCATGLQLPGGVLRDTDPPSFVQPLPMQPPLTQP